MSFKGDNERNLPMTSCPEPPTSSPIRSSVPISNPNCPSDTPGLPLSLLDFPTANLITMALTGSFLQFYVLTITAFISLAKCRPAQQAPLHQNAEPLPLEVPGDNPLVFC